MSTIVALLRSRTYTVGGRSVHTEAAIHNPTIAVEDVELGILDDTLSYYIRALDIAVSRDWEARLEGLDMMRGAGRVAALFVISHHPGVHASVIAQVILKDRSETGRILDAVEGHGLIERRTAPTDSRVRELYLTPDGARVVEELRTRIRKSRAFFADIADDDYDRVVDLLRKLYWHVVLKARPRKEDPA